MNSGFHFGKSPFIKPLAAWILSKTMSENLGKQSRREGSFFPCSQFLNVQIETPICLAALAWVMPYSLRSRLSSLENFISPTLGDSPTFVNAFL